MFCKNCGGKLGQDSKFCLLCGAKVETAESPAPVTPAASDKKKSGFKLYILIIIILSLLIVAESGFIVYYKLIADSSYSDSEDDDKTKNESSKNQSPDDGSSLPSSSDDNSSDNLSSEPDSDEFSVTDICGSWHLSSFTDSEGNEITPEVNAFLTLTLTEDGNGNGIYAVYEGRNEERVLNWEYVNPLSNGSHYYELKATNGDSYALCYNPETNQLYMEYIESDDSETTRYYSLD